MRATLRLLYHENRIELVTSNRAIDQQLKEYRELERVRIRLEEAVLIGGIGYWERRRLPEGGWGNVHQRTGPCDPGYGR